LSFFFYRGSPNEYAAGKKTTSLVNGIIGGLLVNSGLACIGAGVNIAQTAEEDEGFNAFWATAGMFYIGSALIAAGLPCSIISMVYGIQHYAEVVKCRGAPPPPECTRWGRRCVERNMGRSPPHAGGRSTVGLPGLVNIDPRKLPIQRVNWYWVQEE
jgi:hypothetical protein